MNTSILKFRRFTSSARRWFSAVRSITSQNEFEELKMNKTLFVDFYADWCGPCKMISPEFEKLAKNNQSEQVEFVKVNVDTQGEIASEEGIRAMPTFKVYKDGEQVGEIRGADRPGLQQLVRKYV